MNPFDSPFIVPVAGTIMILGIVAVSKFNEYGIRKLQFEERMAAMAKGLTLPEPPVPVREVNQINLRLRKANVRRAGIVLVAAGIGITAFFMLLSWILRERDVLAGAAVGIIPFFIGIGFLIDAKLQASEIPSETSFGGESLPR
jgi:uncharacterized protein YjeT (DUF2065 family)